MEKSIPRSKCKSPPNKLFATTGSGRTEQCSHSTIPTGGYGRDDPWRDLTTPQSLIVRVVLFFSRSPSASFSFFFRNGPPLLRSVSEAKRVNAASASESRGKKKKRGKSLHQDRKSRNTSLRARVVGGWGPQCGGGGGEAAYLRIAASRTMLAAALVGQTGSNLFRSVIFPRVPHVSSRASTFSKPRPNWPRQVF